MLPLAWLLLAITAEAQFNTTIEFPLTALSPMVDMLEAFWAYDDQTGYAQTLQTRRGSGAFTALFLAQGYRLHGEAADRPEVRVTGSRDLLGVVTGTGISNRTELHVSKGVLSEVKLSEATMMELRVSYLDNGLITVHNITLDIPVRTQA